MGNSDISVSSLISWLQRSAAVVEEVHRPSIVRDMFITNALNGDESFAPSLLGDLFAKVAKNNIGEVERAVLCQLLTRLLGSKAGQKIICGVEGRPGQSRRGHVGLRVAMEVSGRLTKGDTAEAAWEAVGESMHMTASAVKQHWMRWKPQFIASVRQLLIDRYPAMSEVSSEELDAFARYMALGERGISLADSILIRNVKQRAGMIDGQSPAP